MTCLSIIVLCKTQNSFALFLRDSVVGSVMCNLCNSSQIISTVSLTIFPTVVSPIRKLNAKARNDIPVERYPKQMNTYSILQIIKIEYNNRIQFHVSQQ